MWTGDDKSIRRNQLKGCPRDCRIYGKWNLPKLEGGIVVLVESMYGLVVVLVGVRGKANRDLIVVASLAETHYYV
jgi:hypothetical protein